MLGTIDAALAAQNAVVALESLRLGSVYIGGLRNDSEGVANELGLPPQIYPVFSLCVSYPSPDRPAKVKPRLPQQAVLHHETYTIAGEEGVLSEYDARLGAFYQREGMNASDWSEQVINRLRNVSSLHGRAELLGELARRGFGLR
ncbi:nitroreductase family protein [Pseudomonas brassicacearum]|uniref:nitroreductase family protein n=1 Tax=Pseudomonas brassicacearum TaxID=930166 RepID=UPI00341440C5